MFTASAQLEHIKQMADCINVVNNNTAWFLLRVHYAGLNVTRPEGEIGKYKSIPHHHRGEVQFLGR